MFVPVYGVCVSILFSGGPVGPYPVTPRIT